MSAESLTSDTFSLRVVRAAIYFMILPARWLERAMNWVRPGWEYHPISASFYFILIAFLSIWAVMQGNLPLKLIGMYFVSAMEVFAIAKCVLISIGLPGVIHPTINIGGRLRQRRSMDRFLLTPTALYMGAVAFLYTTLYFAVVHYFIDAVSMGAYKIEAQVPGATATGVARFWRFVYFSAVTITTLGYGDISPLTFWAQLAVVLELAFSIFFVVFLFGTFVSFSAIKATERIKGTQQTREPDA